MLLNSIDLNLINMRCLKIASWRSTFRGGDKDTVHSGSDSGSDGEGDMGDDDASETALTPYQHTSNHHRYSTTRSSIQSVDQSFSPRHPSVSKRLMKRSVTATATQQQRYLADTATHWEERDDVQLLQRPVSESEGSHSVMIQDEEVALLTPTSPFDKVSYDLHPFEAQSDLAHHVPLELLRIQMEDDLTNLQSEFMEPIATMELPPPPPLLESDTPPNVLSLSEAVLDEEAILAQSPCIGTPEWSRYLQERQRQQRLFLKQRRERVKSAKLNAPLEKAELTTVQEEGSTSHVSHFPIDVITFDSSHVQDSSYDDDIDELEI
jgi:hypothetical protein